MSSIMQYPEFLLAGLLGILLLFGVQRKGQSTQLSLWFTEPAKSFLSMVSPPSYITWIEQSLIWAAWRSTNNLGNFAAFKLYPSLFSLILIAVMPLYAVLALAFMLWFLPDLFLTIATRRRQQEIQRSLPQALDLMVLCVDAGLGIDASLQRISSENNEIGTALNEELKILERELLLGVDREQAYQALYNRTGVDELKSLGSALNQANKLGLSVARIMRAQSDFIRKRQSQKAEEKALKMPIFMAFPLWFCIMPSLMLLVLGPSLIKFYQQLHAGQSLF